MTSKLSGLGMALQEPIFEPYTAGDYEESSSFSLTNVSKNDNVYKEVCIDFDNADLTVVKIERLINPHLWKRYVTERDLMISQRTSIDPDFKPNEKYLYHGTSALKSFICEEGLDSRMSKEGCFGKGIYFSDFPRKCVKYAERGEKDCFILLARVIRGTPKIYKKGEKQRDLVREPEKTHPYKGYRFYDSVEGQPVNHKEFVVYESRRAFVEYIITFSKKSITKALPDSSQSSVADRNHDVSDIESDFSDSDNDARTEQEDDEENSDQRSDICEGEESDEDNAVAYGGSAEVLLKQKKDDFRRKTGVTDDYIVDQYLLRGNLSVSEAVRLYKEKPTDGELTYKDEIPGLSELELELGLANKRPEHPAPGSSEWLKLSEDDKEEVIKSLVEDFLSVTGMTEEDYARTRLSSVNYSLDHAVLAHYEEISSEFGIV